MAELVSRNIILKRRMPAPFSASYIFVSPDAQLKYIKPTAEGFDLMLLRIADKMIHSGMTVWDIGANVGVFSVAAATRGANVTAFEPDQFLAALIRRTTALEKNRLNIRVAPVAISDTDGLSEFMIASRGRASNALTSAGGHSQMGGVRSRLVVPTLTLDTLIKTTPPPDFIKIDVEGAEMMVLNGAKALLQYCRPTILIEVSKATSVPAYELLASQGYEFYEAQRYPDSNEKLTRCVENTIAIPIASAGVEHRRTEL